MERLCLTTPIHASTHWFGLLPFRSPLLGEFQSSSLYAPIAGTETETFILVSFPPGTEMFHFPGYAPYTHVYGISNEMGFPIRKSSDHRLLITFPKLIADCYVLHRCLESRHPPYTLTDSQEEV